MYLPVMSFLFRYIFASITRSKRTFTWSTESWIYVSLMFQSCQKASSSLISAECMLALCSNRLAHYRKGKLYIILAILFLCIAIVL